MIIRAALLATVFLLTGCPDNKAAAPNTPAASAEPVKAAAEGDKSGADKAGTDKKDEGGW